MICIVTVLLAVILGLGIGQWVPDDTHAMPKTRKSLQELLASSADDIADAEVVEPKKVERDKAYNGLLTTVRRMKKKAAEKCADVNAKADEVATAVEDMTLDVCLIHVLPLFSDDSTLAKVCRMANDPHTDGANGKQPRLVREITNEAFLKKPKAERHYLNLHWSMAANHSSE